MSADLTDDEIVHICKPLTQGAAQCRYLRSLGLTVRRRPDGRPLVNRAHYDTTMGNHIHKDSPRPHWKVAA